MTFWPDINEIKTRGTLMKNASLQLICSDISAPNSGPTAGANIAGIAINAIAAFVLSLPKCNAIIDWVTGIKIPALNPCIHLETSRVAILKADPTNSELKRKPLIASIQATLTPARLLIYDESITPIEQASIYPVNAHCM